MFHFIYLQLTKNTTPSLNLANQRAILEKSRNNSLNDFVVILITFFLDISQNRTKSAEKYYNYHITHFVKCRCVDSEQCSLSRMLWRMKSESAWLWTREREKISLSTKCIIQKTAGRFTLKFGKALLRETLNSTFATSPASANIAFLRCASLYSRQPSFMRHGYGTRCFGCAFFFSLSLFFWINVFECHKHSAVLFPSHKAGVKRGDDPTVFGCGECFAFVTYFTGKGSL